MRHLKNKKSASRGKYEKIENEIQNKSWIKKTIILYGWLLVIPNYAFASFFGGQQTEVGRIISAACDWLSGEVAAAIAVLVVIYSGYEMMGGEIDKRKFAMRCIGIGVVVGGSVITKNIFGVN